MAEIYVNRKRPLFIRDLLDTSALLLLGCYYIKRSVTAGIFRRMKVYCILTGLPELFCGKMTNEDRYAYTGNKVDPN